MKNGNNSNERYDYEFESLAATIPDIVYRIDEDGRFTYLNHAIRTLGYEPNELIGKHFSELILPSDVEAISRKHVLPEYTSKVTGDKNAPKLFDERRSTERKTSGLEVRLVHKRGNKILHGIVESIGQGNIITEVSSSGMYQTNVGANSKVFIGTVGVIKDVTNHRWMEAELLKHSERLEELVTKRTEELTSANKQLQQAITECKESGDLSEAILDNSPAGMYIVQDRKFQYVNSPFARVLGLSREQLIGKNPLDLILPEDRESVKSNAVQILKGDLSYAYEYRVLDNAGKIRWIMETVVSVQYRGKRATLGNFMDITERKVAEEKLKQSYEQVQKTLNGITQSIAAISGLRDPYTAGHQLRVAQLARALAEEMNLTDEQANQIYTAGLVHDIGKISLPAEILSKPGNLSNIEYSLIQVHPQASSDVLKNVDFPYPIARWVLEHHERLNGSGYPQGLVGDKISLEARILAVADVVEAMSSHRPYRASLGIAKALEEIISNKGTLYDGNIVDACLNLFNKGFKFK
jgi:PAS domain S-box-containing protein